MNNKLRDELNTIIKSVLRKQEIDIFDEIDYQIPISEEGLGLDSIGRLVLLTELEHNLNIEFPQDKWGSHTFFNTQEIYDYIHKNKIK